MLFLKKIFYEILYWYAMPIGFLLLYIIYFYNPIYVISKHLYPITLIIICSFLCKVFVYQIIKNISRANFLITFLYSTIQFLLLIYYFLVLGSLYSWGKVITSELIVSYIKQASLFFDAIGVSISIVIVSFIFVYGFFFFVHYIFIKKNIFINHFTAKQISPRIIIAAALSLFAMTAIPLHFYFYIKPFVGNEPFHLTMYAGKENALDTLEHPIKYDQALSGLENNIRSNYQINTTRVKRNVILIVVDALRPDHMGVYNYKRNTTPFLTSLDAQGIVQKFSNVRASCGASACGLSTLATARFAHQIPDNPYTLSQVLAKNGYSTQIILSGDHTNFYNLRSLYGKVDTYYDGSMAAPFYMNDDALIIHKLNTLPDFNGKPTLFQFHLMSTHGLSKHMPEFEVYKPNKGYSGNIRGIPSVEHVNYYDNGVIQSDYYINQIMKVLDRKKYLQDALIIVTADHGESLGEHNMYSHANSVYEVLLRVPFLLINAKNTSALTKQASSFSSQADIAPTVLHELGLQIPENWVGKAIQLQSKEDRQSTYTYFQLHPRVGMYIHGDSLWKYWLNTYNSEEFVFNLDEDPNEQRNLITKIDPKLRLKWRELSQKTRTE